MVSPSTNYIPLVTTDSIRASPNSKHRNELNLFTGWKNPNLTSLGRSEAKKGGELLKSGGQTHFDVAYTSVLTRANDTLDIILKEIGQEGLETFKSEKLNERDYGDLTGLNKDDGECDVRAWAWASLRLGLGIELSISASLRLLSCPTR